MKYLMLVLTIFSLSGCYKEEDVIDAKYLALNKCEYTGQSFESIEKVWHSVGRGGNFVDVTKRYYIYICPADNKITLSLVRLVIDKEDI